jgi:iron complex outermembrane recepter protein
LNCTDSYTDARVSPSVPVASYMTVDGQVVYDVGRRFGTGVLSGVVVSLSAQNLFDRTPPRTAITDPITDMGFDPTNANPMGRLVAVEMSKTW